MFSQIKLYLASAAIVAAFGAGFLVNGWRLTAKIESIKLAYSNALTLSIERARTKEQEWETKLNQERDNATKREIQLRKDADSAHAAADGLRSQLSDTARRIAESSPAACIAATATLSELLGNCSDKYLDMAENAQRHASDVETLVNSWPH